MKHRLLPILTLFFLISCSKDNDSLNTKKVCGVSEPTEELEWLKVEIAQRKRDISENTKYNYITQASFEGNVVFLYKNCDPKANSVTPVYSCQGDLLGHIGKDFTQEEIKESEIIFEPIDFACQQ